MSAGKADRLHELSDSSQSAPAGGTRQQSFGAIPGFVALAGRTSVMTNSDDHPTYMRITWAKLQPGRWAAYVQEFKRVADPTTPGLLARWLVHDKEDSESLFVLTLWDSITAIEQWEASRHYREQFLPALKPFILGAYSVSVCEVSYAAVGPDLRSTA